MSEQAKDSAKMEGFDALLDELGTLAKAMEDDEDDKTEGAADDDFDADDAEDDVDPDMEDEDNDDEDDEDDEDAPMGKSFAVQLADGSTAEVFDGAAALASLQEDQRGLRKSLAQAGKVIRQQTDLMKAQATRIGDLTDVVNRLGDGGRGRKTKLTVFNKGGAQDASVPGIEPREFLAKALDAQKAGRITGAEVARAEAYLGRGLALPDDIVSAVSGGNA